MNSLGPEFCQDKPTSKQSNDLERFIKTAPTPATLTSGNQIQKIMLSTIP